MILIQSNTGQQTTMTLGGTLELSNARQAHQLLAEAIRNYTHVAVRIMRIEALDRSFIQLICAAHRTALSQNKRFTLTFEDFQHIKRLLVRCGFQLDCGCDADAAEPCIWQTAVLYEALDYQDRPPDRPQTRSR